MQGMGRWSSTMDHLNCNIKLLVQHIAYSGTTRSPHTTHHSPDHLSIRIHAHKKAPPGVHSPAHGKHSRTPAHSRDYRDNTCLDMTSVFCSLIHVYRFDICTSIQSLHMYTKYFFCPRSFPVYSYFLIKALTEVLPLQYLSHPHTLTQT